jgi:hypothetical protein
MTDAIMYLLSAVVLIIGALLGIEKRKTKKTEKRAVAAEARATKAERQVNLEQQASQIKDDLAKDKATLSKEKEEVIQSIPSTTEGEEAQISEKTKQLAADQYTRARARADKLQNNKSKR